MDYSQVIELDNVTLGDCEKGYKYRGRNIIINDGRVVGFVDEGKDN